MKLLHTKLSFPFITSLLLILFSLAPSACIQKKHHTISLKWNKAYKEDSMKNNVVGLKWCLSFLGSEIALDTTLNGLKYNDSIINLDISKLGFGKQAVNYLTELNAQLKQTEEYQQNKSVDLGRYIALTLGSSFHYYKITSVPDRLNYYQEHYVFNNDKGYIDNSGVSLVDRVISFSTNASGNRQAYISEEIEPETKTLLEFETAELMPNGFVKFGIYDSSGHLKGAANNQVTRAGKPAKCIWCHESGIQSIFKQQGDHLGYLNNKVFKDTIYQNHRKLRGIQDSLWKDIDIKNRRLHTLMELSYISFMEPSADRLAQEWGSSVTKVKDKLQHLETHNHEEFNYLRELYHRKDVDSLAPWKVMLVPESIREKSAEELDYLTFRSYLDQVLNNLSLYSSEKK